MGNHRVGPFLFLIVLVLPDGLATRAAATSWLVYLFLLELIFRWSGRRSLLWLVALRGVGSIGWQGV
jgi:hypothetical protein